MQRITRLMALAIKLDGLLREGAVQSHGQLARLGHVSRSRITQVMNLLHLAPDIQEHLLFLSTIEKGRDTITEAAIRKLAQRPDWEQQRQLFQALLRSRNAE